MTVVARARRGSAASVLDRRRPVARVLGHEHDVERRPVVDQQLAVAVEDHAARRRHAPQADAVVLRQRRASRRPRRPAGTRAARRSARSASEHDAPRRRRCGGGSSGGTSRGADVHAVESSAHVTPAERAALLPRERRAKTGGATSAAASAASSEAVPQHVLPERRRAPPTSAAERDDDGTRLHAAPRGTPPPPPDTTLSIHSRARRRYTHDDRPAVQREGVQPERACPRTCPAGSRARTRRARPPTPCWCSAEVDDEHQQEVRRQAGGERQRADRPSSAAASATTPATRDGDGRAARRITAARLAGRRVRRPPAATGAAASRAPPRAGRRRRAGSTSAYWKSPWPLLVDRRRSCPIGKPLREDAVEPGGDDHGRRPARPRVRFTYFSPQPPSTAPSTMPRARVRCTIASTPLLWSVTSSTRAACGLASKTCPTTPAGASTAMPLRDAVALAAVDGERARQAGRRRAPMTARGEHARRAASARKSSSVAQARVLELDLGEPRRVALELAHPRAQARRSRRARADQVDVPAPDAAECAPRRVASTRWNGAISLEEARARARSSRTRLRGCVRRSAAAATSSETAAAERQQTRLRRRNSSITPRRGARRVTEWRRP